MPAAGIMGRRSGRRRGRRDGGTRNLVRPTPISITTAGWNDAELTLVFNQPVSLKGIPQFPAAAGLVPTGAELISPNTLKLTYPDSGKGAPAITVPFEDPSIRNSSGGYVAPSSIAA